MTVEELQAALHRLDKGVLMYGAHKAGEGEFCALEFDSVVRGRPFSDVPLTLPDLRPINDAFGDDNAARTAALLPVMAALWEWSAWSEARRRAWACLIVIDTVREIVSALPRVPTAAAQQCRNVVSLAEAAVLAGRSVA